MDFLHPGGLELTDAMIEKCALEKGAKLLDLGCGTGDTAAYIATKYGLDVTAADISDVMLERGKASHPDMTFIKCDGMSLDFPSRTFDGAVMECAFSLMQRQEELLHELYCVLKPGAMIAITDLYMLEPDMERAKKNCIDAQKLIYHHREDDECAEEQIYPSPFCLDGMFVKELLLALLEDIGFEPVGWYDKTQALRNYAAQLLMDHGSIEAAMKSLLPDGVEKCAFCSADIGNNTGYFLLVARKPADPGVLS